MDAEFRVQGSVVVVVVVVVVVTAPQSAAQVALVSPQAHSASPQYSISKF